MLNLYVGTLDPINCVVQAEQNVTTCHLARSFSLTFEPWQIFLLYFIQIIKYNA